MLVIFNGCVSRLGALPVTFIVTVDPRSTLIQPNKPPFPSKSLVMYLKVVVLLLLSYSDSTFILRGAADIQLIGATVAVGLGVEFGVLVGVGSGAGVALGVGLGVAFGVAVGYAVGSGSGVLVGLGGATVLVGVGLGVAFGVLVGVGGATVSVGVGVGDVHENPETVI